MIVIKKLRFSNILSYAEGNELDFTASTVTQLNGKNGHGKSSCATILEEALYNKNSRGIKKAKLFNRYLDKKAYHIGVDFEVDGVPYILEKNVAATAKVKLIRDGEDISGHTATQTYKLIEEILGLDFEGFTKLVNQSLLSSLDFLSATDAKRKQFLTGLLGLEKIFEIAKRLKDATKKVGLQAAEVEGEIRAFNRVLDKLTKAASGKLQEELKVPEYDESLEDRISSIKASISNIEDTNRAITFNNRKRKQLSQLQEVNPPTEEKPCAKEIQHLVEESNSLNSKVQTINITLKSLKSNLDKSICGTCGTVLKDKTPILEEISNLERDRKPLEEKHSEVYEEWGRLSQLAQRISKQERDYKTYLETKEELEHSIDFNLPEKLEDETKLEDELSNLVGELRKLKRDIDSAKDHNYLVKSNNETTLKAREELKELQDQVNDSNNKLSRLQEKQARLKILSDAFGTKGLISYKIESMVKVFEDLINKYLQVLSDGRFALQFSVQDTKLTLNLYDNSQEIDINSVSSGEFNRINTATLLAVRAMMSAVSKTSINVLFLDEVVSVLDKDGKDTLIEVLLNEHNLNSIVVSHGYTHPLARVVNVIKEDNISRMEDNGG